jgi:hypothetical protein
MCLSAFFHRIFAVIGALAIAILASQSAFAQAPQRTRPNVPPLAEIRTSDVDLFYRIFDAAGGAPNADALAHAKDKRAAMKTLLELKDPKQILAHSGWRAGVVN